MFFHYLGHLFSHCQFGPCPEIFLESMDYPVSKLGKKQRSLAEKKLTVLDR